MKELRLLVAGHGTVGKGLLELIEKEREHTETDLGVRLPVVAVASSRGAWVDPKGLDRSALVPKKQESTGVEDLIGSAGADLLVEVTPTDLRTGGPALGYVRSALEAGLHVVTANKGPVVLAQKDLLELARRQNVQFRFEATVGASIPLLNLHEECLRGDHVTRMDGVLNGTSNYILSRMGEEGLEFQEALEEAQALGYAEADPSADVDGHDAAAKLVIMANAFLDAGLKMGDVSVTGIRDVTGEAVQLAHRQGYAVRLIASMRAGGPPSVAPRLVPESSTLNVPGTLNVVRLARQHAGPVTLSGRGAGGRETAAAVLADVLSVAARSG